MGVHERRAPPSPRRYNQPTSIGPAAGTKVDKLQVLADEVAPAVRDGVAASLEAEFEARRAEADASASTESTASASPVVFTATTPMVG